MRMLRLHQLGEVVLVNPAHIQMVLVEDEDRDRACGTKVYFGETDFCYVDESVEDIDRLIVLS